MTQDKQEEKTQLTYDDRRKILTQKKSITVINKKDEVKVDGKVTEKEIIMSTVKQSMDVEYTETGIKMAHKNLVDTKKSIENQLKNLKDKIESEAITDELKTLKENLQKLAKLDEAEKAKANYDAMSEELVKVKKELKELKDEIGTRLKF